MENTVVKAKLKNLPMSPQKVRLIVDVVRGKGLEEGIEMLRYLNKSASLPVAKLLNSAAANAEENNKWSRQNLVISKITVGDGIRRRWRRFVSRGRMRTIMRLYCTVDVELSQKKSPVSQASKKPVKAEVSKVKAVDTSKTVADKSAKSTKINKSKK